MKLITPKPFVLLCLTAVGGAPAAYAQITSTAEPPVTDLQEVIVTGSNIRTTLDSELQATPVAVITHQDIEQTSAVSLADVLATNPAITQGADAEQGSGGRGFVNLRGLGTQYTLVLLNGRRLSANDPGNTLAIPAEAIQRVEILKSGASALYGSDAVAGVINVILKSHADGIHASTTYGDSTGGGGQSSEMSLYGGMSSENARFFYLINRMRREEMRASQRAITKSSDKRNFGGLDGREDVIGNPGRIEGITGRPPLIADPNRIARGTYSLDPDDYRPYDPNVDSFDYNAVIDPSVISAPDRTSIIANFELDFLDRLLTFFANGIYWDMKENNYLSMSPISFQDPQVGPIPASNPYNPFGQDLTDVSYRPLELGRRSIYTEAYTRRFSAGLRAEIGDWQIESAASSFRGGFEGFERNSIIKSRLKKSLNRPGSDAFNPFCNQCNTKAQFEGMLTDKTRDVAFRSDLADLRANGPLFELPTGTVQSAVGAEFRREGVAVGWDPLSQNADFVGSSGTYSYDLGRTIRSVFAELRIPLMSKPEGEHESPLELSMATRYESYSDFGSTSNPLATLRYSMLDGQLTARASWASAFLAPYLEYATPQYRTGAAHVLQDPVTGEPIQAYAYENGATGIKPETSTTRNLGLIAMPDAIPGLMLSLDYYAIEQTNFVPGVSAQSILEGAAPGTITRGNGIGPGGEDMIIEGYYYNKGQREMAGFEFGMHYELPKLAIGQLQFDLALARLDAFKVQVGDSDALVDIAGGYDRASDAFFSTGSLPKTRGQIGLSWSRNAWYASSRLNYMSGYDEMDSFGVATGDRVPSYFTTDLQVGYELGGKRGAKLAWLPVKGMQLALGARNVFNRDPPFLKIINNYNSSDNDVLGRYIYARIGVDF